MGAAREEKWEPEASSLWERSPLVWEISHVLGNVLPSLGNVAPSFGKSPGFLIGPK